MLHRLARRLATIRRIARRTEVAIQRSAQLPERTQPTWLLHEPPNGYDSTFPFSASTAFCVGLLTGSLFF